MLLPKKKKKIVVLVLEDFNLKNLKLSSQHATTHLGMITKHMRIFWQEKKNLELINSSEKNIIEEAHKFGL